MIRGDARKEKTLISVDEYHLVGGHDMNVMEDTDPGGETNFSRKYEVSTESKSVITSG